MLVVVTETSEAVMMKCVRRVHLSRRNMFPDRCRSMNNASLPEAQQMLAKKSGSVYCHENIVKGIRSRRCSQH